MVINEGPEKSTSQEKRDSSQTTVSEKGASGSVAPNNEPILNKNENTQDVHLPESSRSDLFKEFSISEKENFSISVPEDEIEFDTADVKADQADLYKNSSDEKSNVDYSVYSDPNNKDWQKIWESDSMWSSNSNLKLVEEGEKVKEVMDLRPVMNEAFKRLSEVTGEKLPPSENSFNEEANNNYGRLFKKNEQSKPTEAKAAEELDPTGKTELSKQLESNLIADQGYYHETSGESRGRAYKSKIETTLKLLKEDKLDLEDPENKKLVVMIARQLYGEAALEPTFLPAFAKQLKMFERGRDTDPALINKISESLTADQVQMLLDGSVYSLEKRLVKAPTPWLLEKSDKISDKQLETIRDSKGETVESVTKTMKQVWGEKELNRIEKDVFNKTGYNTDIANLVAESGSYSGAVQQLVAQGKLTSKELASVTYLINIAETAPAYRSGSIEKLFDAITVLLEDSDRLQVEKKKEEQKEQASNQYNEELKEKVLKAVEQYLSTLGIADTVVDLSMKKYQSVEELIRLTKKLKNVQETNPSLPASTYLDDSFPN
jgi:hypothetical protein